VFAKNGVGAGVDSAWRQRKLEARKMLVNAARTKRSPQRPVYPLFAGVAFAVHPNLLSLSISHDAQEKIAEFHRNSLLHFGHVLMLLGAPLLIVIALHFMDLMEKKAAWWGFLGGVLAVFGAVILAADKGALCLVPSAFDTLPKPLSNH
jgi:hypothetical protein